MNIIGFYVPKIIELLAILIPKYDFNLKVILIILWLCEAIIDYSHAKPGHQGKIYRLTEKISPKHSEDLCSVISLIPIIAFEIVSIKSKIWAPAIVIGFPIVVSFFYILYRLVRRIYYFFK